MLKSIKLSDFIKIPSSPFILGALISRIMTFKENDKNYFYAYTSFRASKFVHYSQFDLVKYSKELIKKLNFYSHYDNWTEHKIEKTSVELRFYILDDVGMSKKAFYKFIYQRIVSSAWILNQSEKDMYECMRGFMELRGSVDTSLKLIAQDYFYDDSNELKKAQILTQLLNIPISYANFNARDLQPQFVNGTNKRNTQFRIK